MVHVNCSVSVSPHPHSHTVTLSLLVFFYSKLIFILQVVDFYNYDDIGEVTTIKSSSLQIVMHTGGRVLLTTNKAGKQRSWKYPNKMSSIVLLQPPSET